ncbi:MAG TPA: dTDP-4-dehydrorhamnose 3,5-epimerase [Burkholderiales bacterium]|nr:dTDP-4-dehydrorhamnose 3,5-epimerase [Burkholderiales bacterium]
MKVTPTAIPDVLLIEPTVFVDERGFFFESYSERTFARALGIECRFVQDNQSRSKRDVLRGLHYQVVRPQAKLVRCIAGEVLDIAVDLRRSSATFGKWVSFKLDDVRGHTAYIPAGFAHGFVVRSASADILYKTSDFYFPEFDRCIAWNDPDLAIDWQLEGLPILSEKDRAGAKFRDAEVYP